MTPVLIIRKKTAGITESPVSGFLFRPFFAAMILVLFFQGTPALAGIAHAFKTDCVETDHLLNQLNAPVAVKDPDPLHNNRFVRVLIASGKTSFFIDKGHFKGFEYEFLSAYETFINQLMDRYFRIKVIFIPVALKDIFDLLQKGYGDIAATGLASQERPNDRFSFSRPYIRDEFRIRAQHSEGPGIEEVNQPLFHSGGNINLAVRKGNTKLLDTLNRFIEKNRKGSHLGNILYNRYYRNSRWIGNQRPYHTMDLFPDVFRLMAFYGEKYRFNPLLLMAVAYRESRFDQDNTSPKGAVGIMQVMPRTAADPNVDIENIHDLEDNIHAGVKYLYHLRTRYFDKPSISRQDRFFFTLAAYNAGPERIKQMRQITQKNGGNPDKWFFNVERTAAQKIGQEVVEYVADVYKYFVAYQLQSELLKNPDNSGGTLQGIPASCFLPGSACEYLLAGF